MSDELAGGGLARELVLIDSVVPDPKNARKHDGRNMDAIMRSLAEFGQQKPIVLDADGICRAGNGTLEAAKRLGWSEIWVVRSPLRGIDAAAYAIADNRTGDLSEFDPVVLAGYLQELPASKVIGFDDAEIAEIMASLANKDGNVSPDWVPDPPAVPVSRPGDVWVLGDHVLWCGDARDRAGVANLLAGAPPFMMVTDPPYGVEYDPTWRHKAGLNKSTRTGSVQNDDVADWTDVWRLFTGSVAYVWHGGLHSATVQRSLEDSGMAVRAQIVWIKPRMVLSRGAYHWQHEPAFVAERSAADAEREEVSGASEFGPEDGEAFEAWYAVKQGQTAKFVGGRKQTTVWEIGFAGEVKTHHGTQKPVECMARAIKNHGSPGNVVWEPFCGSGTTIIACEQTGRRCRAIELDPLYVDVAVTRWAAFTGKVPVLRTAGGDLPWADVVRLRAGETALEESNVAEQSEVMND